MLVPHNFILGSLARFYFRRGHFSQVVVACRGLLRMKDASVRFGTALLRVEGIRRVPQATHLSQVQVVRPTRHRVRDRAKQIRLLLRSLLFAGAWPLLLFD